MEYHPDAWTELNAVQRDILVVLAFDGPLNGQEIKNKRGGCSNSTTYRNVEQLVATGHIKKTGDPGYPRSHSLTPDGADLVREAVVETGVMLVAEVADGDA